jgi:hypothetical protein
MESPEARPGLVLYYRENCHLCDSMRRQLAGFDDLGGAGWQEVDIDRDPALIMRFDALVPVLFFDGREICHHFLDRQALTTSLAL